MKSTNIIIPTLFHSYFMTNFNLTKFKIENEDNIREYAIYDYMNNSNETVLRTKITQMLKMNYYTNNIKIHNDFPSSRLIEIMKPYLNIYLHCMYTTESNKKIHYETLLNNKLKQFAKYNPRFGRKLVVQNKNSVNKRKQYINKIDDKHIPYNNIHDTNFMNNHLIIMNDDDEDSDSESDNENEDNNTYYTSDDDIMGMIGHTVETYRLENIFF